MTKGRCVCFFTRRTITDKGQRIQKDMARLWIAVRVRASIKAPPPVAITFGVVSLSKCWITSCSFSRNVDSP